MKFDEEYLTHDFFNYFADAHVFKSMRPGTKAHDPTVSQLRAMIYLPSEKLCTTKQISMTNIVICQERLFLTIVPFMNRKNYTTNVMPYNYYKKMWNMQKDRKQRKKMSRSLKIKKNQ